LCNAGARLVLASDWQSVTVLLTGKLALPCHTPANSLVVWFSHPRVGGFSGWKQGTA
jgi:hypothetical protein